VRYSDELIRRVRTKLISTGVNLVADYKEEMEIPVEMFFFKFRCSARVTMD